MGGKRPVKCAEHGVKGVGQIPNFIMGSLHADAVVKSPGRSDRGRGIDGPERLDDPTGHEPANNSADDRQQDQGNEGTG